MDRKNSTYFLMQVSPLVAYIHTGQPSSRILACCREEAKCLKQMLEVADVVTSGLHSFLFGEQSDWQLEACRHSLPFEQVHAVDQVQYENSTVVCWGVNFMAALDLDS